MLESTFNTVVLFVIPSLEQAAAYAAKIAAQVRAATVENSDAETMLIDGAPGPNASLINGLYLPTQETGSDGRILYIKCDIAVCVCTLVSPRILALATPCALSTFRAFGQSNL